MGERIKAMPKAALLHLAERIGVVGGHRRSATALGATLAKRIADRKGATTRAGKMIDRGLSDAAIDKLIDDVFGR